MKLILFLFVVSLSGTAKANIRDIAARNKLESLEVAAGRHFWVDLAAKSNSSLEEKGLMVGLGHRWEFFGADLRLSYGLTQYGAIRGLLDYNQSYGDEIHHDAWVGNEQLRPRPANDRWKYFMIEPGLSVEGKLFPGVFPLLTERVRAGFGYGSFTDDANSLSFTGYLYTVEAALIYQLGLASPWAISGSFYWNAGNIMLSTSDPGVSQSDRSIAVSWIGTSLGILYSF